MVHGFATGLLRRHIRKLPLGASHAGICHAVHGARDAEIDHLHRAFVGNQDVLRGNIPVDDMQGLGLGIADGVRVVQPRQYLRGDEGGQRGRQLVLLGVQGPSDLR